MESQNRLSLDIKNSELLEKALSKAINLIDPIIMNVIGKTLIKCNFLISSEYNSSFITFNNMPYLKAFPFFHKIDSSIDQSKKISFQVMAETALQHGFGVALPNPNLEQPPFLFPFGVIDGLLRFGQWQGDPADNIRPPFEEDSDPSAADGPQACYDLGAPTQIELPPYAARAILRHFHARWGITTAAARIFFQPNIPSSRNMILLLPPQGKGFNQNQAIQEFNWHLTANKKGWVAFLDKTENIINIEESRLDKLSLFH